MQTFKSIVKKVVKWSLVGGAIVGAYGLGSMKSDPGYISWKKGQK